MSKRKAIFEYSSKHELSNVEKKEIRKDVENRYKEFFWTEYKAIIDQVKPGFGTSNTGPMIDRVLGSSKKLAEILEIDEELVSSTFDIIKITQSSLKPDINEFIIICKRFYNTYLAKYSSFSSLFPHIHKVLVHGEAAIQSFAVGQGVLSEQSQEAINKTIRNVRLKNTRKTSYADGLFDLANYLYAMSDPVVNLDDINL